MINKQLFSYVEYTVTDSSALSQHVEHCPDVPRSNRRRHSLQLLHALGSRYVPASSVLSSFTDLALCTVLTLTTQLYAALEHMVDSGLLLQHKLCIWVVNAHKNASYTLYYQTGMSVPAPSSYF